MLAQSLILITAIQADPSEVHVGLRSSLAWLSENHALFDEDERLDNDGHRVFLRPSPAVSTFASWRFHRHFRADISGRLIFANDANHRYALAWSADVGIFGVLPILNTMRHWSLLGYAGAGLGALGVGSSRIVLGNDQEFTGYIGAGVMFSWTRWMTQIETRHYISEAFRDAAAAHHRFLGIALGVRVFPWRIPEARTIFD